MYYKKSAATLDRQDFDFLNFTVLLLTVFIFFSAILSDKMKILKKTFKK